MDNNDHGEEKPNEKYKIDNELSTIVEKKILPPKIAEKIQKKLKEKDIKISKEQLYKLVEKIQDIMYTYEKIDHPESKKTEIQKENTDMKKLVETIEKLGERIKTIEENQFEGIKGITGEIVKTKDIKTVEKADVSLQGEMEPLIEVPKDPENVVVLMKWLQYLVDKLGKNHLPDVLGYYVDIDWISDDVRLDLINYSKGITDESDMKGTEKASTNLSTKDHIQSLLFILKLKGKQLDDRFMCRLDREMEKMAKSILDLDCVNALLKHKKEVVEIQNTFKD